MTIDALKKRLVDPTEDTFNNIDAAYLALEKLKMIDE